MDRRSKTQRFLSIEVPAALAVCIAILPVIWMIITSLKPSEEIMRWPVEIWPSHITLEHYRSLLKETSFSRSILDSAMIAIGAVALGLGVSVPAAYAFSRFRFRGRGVLLAQFLVINMFPVVLLIIPLFVLMRNFGLIDTPLGIILGHATFAIPFSIWMMTGYMKAIPIDLDEASAIDGASRLQTLWLVVLPLTMPGIVTTGIYIFVTSWNEYLFAMMLSGQNVRPVTVAMQSFIGEFALDWGLLSAGGTLVALPVILLFLLVQRRLVSGMTSGAVK
ncbi:carbohydrate ABC transporter permease [Ahrensia kielensis]|uniref:carbohydrate ABC transporter permease n=1 Tax=Ahrensia kielensis TaxID=76980 RepID=UPI003CCC8554